MEQLASLGLTLATFTITISVLVFVHELGHYLVARRCGVGVEVFSIGFGKELFGWNDKHGTRWCFSAIPLGGYVKMFGDADATSVLPDQERLAAMSPTDRQKSLFSKTVGQRIAVSLAGPLANYLFAIVLLTGLFATVGQPYTPPLVHSVVKDSAAEKAGFKPNDLIVSIDGHAIAKFDDVLFEVRENLGKELQIDVKRDGQIVPVKITPDIKEMTDRLGKTHKVGMLGIQVTAKGFTKRSLGSAAYYAVLDTYGVTVKSLRSIGEMIMGSRSSDGLSGVIGIAQVTGQAAQMGFAELLWLMAFISISLGLINLFPIPMLDGGHVLFYTIEGIRGKPLSEKAQEIGFRIGLTFVICLMLFATWNDIVRLGWVQKIINLF